VFTDIEGVQDRRDAVVSARTYYYEGEPECDRNAAVFAKCVETAAALTGGAGFSVIKVTALGRPQLLLRLSEALINYHNFFRLLTGATDDVALVGAKFTLATFVRRLDELGLAVRTSFSFYFFTSIMKFICLYIFLNFTPIRLWICLVKADKKLLVDWFNECDADHDGAIDVYEWCRLTEHKWRLAELLKALED